MGLIDLFRSRFTSDHETKSTTSGTSNPEPWLFDLFSGGSTLSGPPVTPATAMRVPAVKASVELISSTVGTLPCKIFVSNDKGGKDADPAHPAYGLVHDDANEWTSAGKLRELLTADALLHGNGFAAAVRVNGKVQEFIRLVPGTVTVEIATTGEPVYKVREGRGERRYSFKDVLHVAAPASFDGVTGIAPIFHCREAIGLALTLEQHAARLFGNGARPSGILSLAPNVSAEAFSKIKTAWQAAHDGSANSGKTAVIPGEAQFTQLMLTSVDSQFAEMRTFQTVEIARAFRVPPHMIFEMGRATWSNTEELNRHFLTYSLMPWLKAWEAAYRRVLLPVDQREGVTIEFVVDALLSATTAQRATAYQQFRAAGIMTANEIRALENLPALPDGNSLASPFTSTDKKTEAPADE